MKKITLIALLVLACGTMVHAQEPAVRIPSGYRGYFEQGTLFRIVDGWNNSICISTTHGFFFNDHIFVGFGISIEGNIAFGSVSGNGNEEYLALPVFTAFKYNFGYNHKATPTVQARLGSFISGRVGGYCDLAAGVRFGTSKLLAINVLLFGTLYSDNKLETYDYTTHTYNTTNFNTSGVGLRIGLEW